MNELQLKSSISLRSAVVFSTPCVWHESSDYVAAEMDGDSLPQHRKLSFML